MKWRAAALLLVVACGGGDDDGGSIPARVPDVEGVVVAADAARLVLDGGRSYDIGEDASSVSTYTLEAVPVRLGTYVHVGLDDDERVEWIATIGIVADTDPPGVTYTGTLVSVRGDRAIFGDGTALRVPDGLEPDPGFVVAVLDPASGVISVSR